MSVTARIGSHACRLRGRTRALLAAVGLLVGIGALYGGLALLTDAEGLGVETSWLEGTPFPDYAIPGLFLFGVIGCGMLAAASLALIGNAYAALAAFCMGVTLLVFLVVETIVIGYQGGQQIPLLASMGVSALVLAAVGWRAVRGDRGAGGA